MFISVVIPVYNRTELLVRAVKSVFAQTHQDYEVIVVDDNSTENIEECLRGYPVQFLRAKSKGVSAARNEGVLAAKGEWVAFLDSDDEWKTDKLLKQVEYLRLHPECEFVHTNEVWMRNGQQVVQQQKHQKEGGRCFSRSTELCLIAASTVLMKKDFFIELGMFDESFVVCEDFDLWLRVTSRVPVGFLQEPLVVKHAGHDGQLSLQHHSMDLWRVRALTKHLNSILITFEEKQALCNSLKKKIQIVSQGLIKYPNQEVENELAGLEQKISELSS